MNANTRSSRGRWNVWALALGTVLLVLTVLRFVEVTPEVSEDFFFAAEDPQLAASRQVQSLFPGAPQVLILARAEAGINVTTDTVYQGRLEGLTDALREVRGVDDVSSLVRGPSSPTAAADSPLWRRLLLPSSPAAPPLAEPAEPSEAASPEGAADLVTSTTGAPSASLLLVLLEGPAADPEAADPEAAVSPPDPAALVTAIEAVLAQHRAPGFDLVASGVPVVTEQIRRLLLRDLRVMSFAAFLVFGVAAMLVFRSLRAVTGMLLACAAAAAVTLAVLSLAEVAIGPLTANLATLVFVLTLSHTLFLANACRRLAVASPTGQGATGNGSTPWDEASIRRTAVAQTLPASLWCALTTALGFASLLLTSAQPLRELGVAGLVGTVAALVAAYGVAVPFLGRSKVSRSAGADAGVASNLGARGLRLPRPIAITLGLLMFLAFAVGITRVQTDPGLLEYFAAGGELRAGLEAVDAAGGSSPLELVVRAPADSSFEEPEALRLLASAQAAVESDPAVGSALSAAVLLEEARRSALARFLTPAQILDLLSKPAWDSIAKSFVTEDRSQARLFLRMREGSREESRREVVERVRAAVEAEGLEVELVGGLYDLQGRLAELVTSSLVTGLGGLGVLFVFIALWVGRRWRVALAMVGALAIVPLSSLGVLGLLGRPLDVIASPAANVALALGVDSMIHLTLLARRRGGAGALDWAGARQRLAPAILGAAVVVGSGFGLFALSSFPPTRSFGLAVLVGTLAAALAALVLLPSLAGESSSSD